MKFLLLVIFLLTAASAFSQTNYSDTTRHTFMLVGPACPVCNDKHPENKFDFIIKCVGCITTPEIEANNKLVIQYMDKKYGQGWTKNYLKTYCQDFPINQDKKQVILKQK